MGKRDLCERCGQCCRFKKPYDRFWVAEDRYCPYFGWLPDGKGNCRIYAHHLQYRIDHETQCIPAADLARMGLLPESCPYTTAIPGYRSKVINYGEGAVQGCGPIKETPKMKKYALLVLTLVLIGNMAFGQTKVFIGEYRLFDMVGEIGWQYKGGTPKALLFFNPADPVGDGLVPIPINGSGKFIFEFNGAVYEITRTGNQIINVYRR